MSTTPVIAGIDEAGRGALAGPVIAAACVLQVQKVPAFIRDSKQLTADQREEAFAWIAAHCAYGIGMTDAREIDSSGILAATEKAMQKAVAELSDIVQPTYLLIDGRDKFWFDLPHSSIIRGDETEACISAASIIAKVTRDRLMTEYHKKFPRYGFHEHKGYGVPMHFALMQQHGPCDLHRKTFLKSAVVQIALDA